MKQNFVYFKHVIVSSTLFPKCLSNVLFWTSDQRNDPKKHSNVKKGQKSDTRIFLDKKWKMSFLSNFCIRYLFPLAVLKISLNILWSSPSLDRSWHQISKYLSLFWIFWWIWFGFELKIKTNISINTKKKEKRQSNCVNIFLSGIYEIPSKTETRAIKWSK